MTVEHERRFQLSEGSERFRQRIGGDWVQRRVLDVTFGPSGPQSMDRDGWVVRVRVEKPVGGEVEYRRLEYKAKLAVSTWTEIGVTVVDTLPQTAALLQAIGLLPGMVIDRIRSTVSCGVTVSVDEVRWLGTFVELSGPPLLVSAFATDIGLHEAPEMDAYGDLLLAKILADVEVKGEHEQTLRQLIEHGP